ncbi:hypothetical protein DVH24_014320 [Malus domestica]|uniref:Uncharacterized protein n=1 Tax=Malus domestica TaxID=3750 RepID=A0A498JIC5_MALDO|nr:hypothetical protein DVH24_014320 [Malus domestica]
MLWNAWFVPTSMKTRPGKRVVSIDGPLSSQNLGKFESLEKVEICLEPRKNELGKVLKVLRSTCSQKFLLYTRRPLR